ncbi:MAG TPA: efflux RND transporter periplasmic adaptor subunit [Candidatus Baltobacteraceae bacterium]|nr:efflux RND transporter periplasmic adaptor subunit [Candidatus Baltobacteraceae bacterium]
MEMRTAQRFGNRMLAWLGHALVLVVVAVAVAACSNGETSQGNRNRSGASAIIPVVVGDVVSKTVPVQIRVVGNVQAYASVTLKSQLDAEVAQVQVKEGQNVKKGDVLFLLDGRPWEAALNQAEATLNRDRAQLQQARAAVAQTTAAVRQAEANLARDQAQLENANTQLRRYKGLMAEGAISNELYDQVRTTAAALEATIQADQAAITNAQAMIESAKATVENVQAQIKADEANIQNARVQLGYATIRAPMDAQAGNLLVRAGSAVKARDDTAQMLVLNQIRPIYVSFSVPEQYLNDIKKYQATRSLQVEAFPPGEDKAPATGELTFMNNTVDPTTGMIQLKATFANNRGLLWPGQFVSVLLTLTTRPDSVVVPSQAIQTGQQGQYVYVVRPDSTVESRVVTVAMRLGPETVIEKGVSPGEKIVTDGQVRLVPGARVQAKPANGEAKTDTAEATQKP